VENLMQDFRYAVRLLSKNPGFTFVAVLALALGVGANTAIFSLVNSVLLKRLPFGDAEHLVWIWSTRTDRDKAFYSIPNFIDTRDQNQTLDQIAAFANWGANLTDKGEAERVQGVRLSAHAFEMLGVEAAVGRTLIAEDDRPDKPRVVVVSYGLWQRRFGGERGLIGRTVSLNGDAYTVVGVLPKEFVIPNAEVEIATPLRIEADPRRSERGSNFLRVFARLKHDSTAGEARADLAAISDRLRRQYPNDNGKLTAPAVLPLLEEITGGYRAALFLLFGSVGLVLLIACANLASLLLARATARHKEIAIRAALGATRWRLIRQLLAESLLLALTGGALGLLLAAWGKDLLLALSPADLPRAVEVSIDARVLVFTFLLSLLAGIVFGLAPAWQATKTDLNAELKEGGRDGSGGKAQGRVRNALVVIEVALSLMLLIGAGLLIKSLARLQSVSPGFDINNLLAVRVSLPPSRYSKPEAVKVFYEKLAPRLAAVPGVESAGVSNVLPLSGMFVRTEFSIVGRPPFDPADTPAAQNRWVSPGYFETMKLPIREGRGFTEADNERAAGVVVVDEALARQHWPDESPIGWHLMISFGGEPPRDFEIVGVAGNVKHSTLNEETTAAFYAPIYQVPQSAVSFLANNMSIVVRSNVNPEALKTAVRRELQAVDSEVAASSVKTMSQFLSASIASRRFSLLLLSVFAGIALLLAVGGLYAVISYTVAQRTREIGIRLTLGAQTEDVFKLIIWHGMKLTLAGAAIGLLAAFALTRSLSSLLFGVSAQDPATFVLISLLLTGVALGACFVPARRATKVDPMVALRYE
jgi:putative ABC transport system permease protein